MELVVGTNCYTDIAQATELIDNYLTPNDQVRNYWDSVADEATKKSIILGTTHKYDRDSMFYKGFKQSVSQPLQFPRVDVYKNVIECPVDIKLGLLIQGIKMSISQKYAEYMDLKAQGVKSYKIKDASVEFFDGISSSDVNTVQDSNGMYKSIYNQYFKDWTDLL
mgnify:CR=1 FL=1